MDENEYRQIAAGNLEKIDPELLSYLLERGYVFSSPQAENDVTARQWAAFQTETDASPVQLLLIPSYGCNIACKYCYQAGMQPECSLMQPEMVDAFFTYAESTFGNHTVKPFVTLFGGEPLIHSPAHKQLIAYIIKRCNEHDYELAVVTNGYDLIDYVDLLAAATIKEIQVTLDGTREVHDRRRGTANGKGTFDRIIAGLEKAIARNIPINLRTVTDHENIDDLVGLAEFLDQKGWLDLPAERFKTQIGRNYELFECYAKPQHLMGQAELWRAFSEMSKAHPILTRFHQPDFKGIRHLVDTGEMYMASFDTCPAAKTEWVFDLHGDIYGCTASCGREEFKLGSFYPEVRLNTEAVSQWQDRNVNNIEECQECRYNVICGGGCGVIAANRTGRILGPDCRPIQELIELGVHHYQQEILDMAAPESEMKTSGCRICGEDLVYRPASVPVLCEQCGVQEESSVACANGHYVCDACHSGDILGRIEQYCLKTGLTDPMEILRGLCQIKGLNMHGPEYHSMVPAALVSACANRTGGDRARMVREAVQRGRDIKGGSCGLHGMCGAAGGTGIAYSVIGNVSPLSREERGNGMRVTAAALTEISRYNGPRCCKREAALAVEVAAQMIPGLEGSVKDRYVCGQFKDNPTCLKKDCPYFPRGKKKEAQRNE